MESMASKCQPRYLLGAEMYQYGLLLSKPVLVGSSARPLDNRCHFVVVEIVPRDTASRPPENQ